MPAEPTHSTHLDGEALRQVRESLGLSQSKFAEELRKAGLALGEPNRATKRLVQHWEWGHHQSVRANYVRALERVTSLPYSTLCGERPVSCALQLKRLDRILGELRQLRNEIKESHRPSPRARA